MSSTTLPQPERSVRSTAAARTRVRVAAIALSTGIALLYGLIAAHVVTVIDGPASQVAQDQLGFALPAAVVHLLGAALLWRFDRRLLWIGGVILQALIIALYFAVAPQRDPTFEIWGITIRILQFGLLAALTYLSIRPARPRDESGSR